jgi:hypothetical protein
MPSKELQLVIRATNGATWPHKFNSSEKVGAVLKQAENHFIKAGSLQPGDYGLALVVDGKAQPPLDNGTKLSDAGVHDGATLALIPLEKQTDGT